MIAVPFHQNAAAVRGFVVFSRVVAVLIGTVALVVLAGWCLGVPLLTTLVPGQHAMKANAAIAFALSGLALFLTQDFVPPRWRLGPWLSIVVAGIGAVTLGEYLWSLDPGFDHLFDDPVARAAGLPPGRMAVPAAFALTLLGVLGLLVSTQRYLVLRETIATVLLAIVVTGLASYAVALAGKIGGPFAQVPLPTLLMLLLAVLGWLSSSPTTGLTRVATADTFGGALARRLLLPSLLLPVIFVFVLELLQSLLGLPETLAFAFVALGSGGAVAGLVWWVASLLDKLERQRMESALLRNDADTDVLTGLANRRAFDGALARLLHGQRERDTVFSLLMLDLDRFKAYNDDYGHLAGDQVLRITGHLLRAALRPSDRAARYGGEEFVLLLPEADAAGAREVAERILHAFRGFAWPQRAVTVSIGVAQAVSGDTAADLIQRADAALYAAKRAGRDQAAMAATAPAASPA
ncbi:MAG: diguanylate cyclase domain-containing protein [Rhodanobacter sp.]